MSPPKQYVIHVSTFRDLPFSMQRIYADHYNVPKNCTTEEICNIIFPETVEELQYIPHIPGHVLYWVPGPDGDVFRPFLTVMDLVDWLLETRTSELVEPKKWIPELSDGTNVPHSRCKNASSTTVHEDGVVSSAPQPVASTSRSQSARARVVVTEQNSGMIETDRVSGMAHPIYFDNILNKVDELRQKLEKARTRIKETRLNGREAAADLWEVEALVKKNRLFYENLSLFLADSINKEKLRRIRMEARFGAKYNRLPVVPSVAGNDEDYLSQSSQSSDETATSEGSNNEGHQDSDDSDSDSDSDSDPDNEGQHSATSERVSGHHSSGKRNVALPSVDQRFQELQWHAFRSPIPTREKGRKRIREDEDDVSDQSEYEQNVAFEFKTPSPPKKRRFDDGNRSPTPSPWSHGSARSFDLKFIRNEESANMSWPDDNKLDNPSAYPSTPNPQILNENLGDESLDAGNKLCVGTKWNDYPSANSDDSASSFNGHSSSSNSSGTEDYILDSADEVEIQVECDEFLSSSDNDTTASDDYFGDNDNSAIKEKYDISSDDSGIRYTSNGIVEAVEQPEEVQAQEPTPPPPKGKPLGRSYEFLYEDRGQPVVMNSEARHKYEKWLAWITEISQDEDWDLSPEDIDMRIAKILQSSFDDQDSESSNAGGDHAAD